MNSKERPGCRLELFFCKSNSRGASDLKGAKVHLRECLGKLEPSDILAPFTTGADGVLLITCPIDECKVLRKSREAKERIASLRRAMLAGGLDEKRLRMEWCALTDYERLVDIMTEFKDNLEQMEKIESPPDEDEQGKLLEYALCELEACAWSGAREQVREFDMKRNVFYHPGHCWVKKENGTLVVGIDDFARRLLGSVDEVILPEENKMVFCGEPGITFRCGDRIAEMLSPVTGIVTRVNGRLKEKPGLVCEDSYRRGWLFTVTPKDLKREVREYLYGYDARKWLESDAEELHEDIGEDLGATMADGGVLTGDFSSRVGKEDWERITRRFFRTQR